MSPVPSVPRLFALVPCAGSGSRSGAQQPKQYVRLAGEPMVAHTLRALGQVTRLEATLVVLAPGDDSFAAALPGFEGPRGWLARCGGDTRAATVAQGLVALRARGAVASDWVLVHDAARCLLRPEWVDDLIDACLGDATAGTAYTQALARGIGADAPDGGLLALPLADTLKQAVAGRVAATVDRRDKWAAQTPQMFTIGLLQQALAAAGDGVTDESSAVEALGRHPRLVPAPAENFKVTWPADFELAERLLRTRSGPTAAALPAETPR